MNTLQIIAGPSTSDKSTYGKTLAARLGATLLDIDIDTGSNE